MTGAGLDRFAAADDGCEATRRLACARVLLGDMTRTNPTSGIEWPHDVRLTSSFDDDTRNAMWRYVMGDADVEPFTP